jgi:hypothetical protein
MRLLLFGVKKNGKYKTLIILKFEHFCIPSKNATPNNIWIFWQNLDKISIMRLP